MSEKNQSEYNRMWNEIQYYSDIRNHVAQEIADLQNQRNDLYIARAAVGNSLSNLNNSRSQIRNLPAQCSNWTGLQADRHFKECYSGGLKNAYDQVIRRTERIQRRIDEAINEISYRIRAEDNRLCELNRVRSNLIYKYDHYWN